MSTGVADNSRRSRPKTRSQGHGRRMNTEEREYTGGSKGATTKHRMMIIQKLDGDETRQNIHR